jgi:hypothetical protein
MLELRNKFSKFSGNKIKMSCISIHNELLKKEIWKTIPFTIATKNKIVINERRKKKLC